ncbi:phosphoglucosamine mutase, partial [Candidatus Peregrinibacteria bacterium]|nr:phosphoglucosamine mutase [Candidatus Peregrinibacteria bacterium]
MRKRLFGTDGIRGLVGQYPLTEEVVLRLGMAIGKSVASARAKGINKVIIGKDTRSSCQMIQETLAPGILSRGIEVIDIGIVPTPAVAFLTKRFHAGMGVMISASHNQMDDNGIKLFSENGYKVSDDVENQIEEFIYQGLNDRCDSKFPTDGLKGYAEIIPPGENLYQMYVSNVLESMEKRLDLKGMKVVIDCANGSVSGIVSSIFGKLGLEVITI